MSENNKSCERDILVRKTDLEAVCKAVIDHHARYQYDDNGPHTGWECIYCSGWVPERDEGRVEMRHDVDCPVLVARDIRPRQSPNAPAQPRREGGAE